MSARPIIETQDIRKIYGIGDASVLALDGVSLKIMPGEFVAIMGPSGSGKSTLMHILGCLDSASGGTYVLDGTDVSTLRRRELARVRNEKVGFVFQTFNLMPRLTVEENVALPLQYRGGFSRRERLRRARTLLERLGLAHRLGHRPDQLSGGERQRVAVARALVGEPAILLVDEPTGNLDSTSGAEVLRTFRDVHGLGNTIVLVTHDPHVADEADRLIQIADGVVAA
jgi:ABC-type lipoprotein export system ATPase subunit